MDIKKIFTSLFILTIFFAPVVGNAQQNRQGVHDPGADVINSELGKMTQGAGQEEANQNARAVSRRSRVSNAVQEMERIAVRNQGIGDQVRTIAQSQNRIQERAEEALQTVRKRSGFTKFFIGPNYRQIKAVEERLENHAQNLAALKELRTQIQFSADKTLLDEQIEIMEEIKEELENEVDEEKKGISLFGWLSKILVK